MSYRVIKVDKKAVHVEDLDGTVDKWGVLPRMALSMPDTGEFVVGDRVEIVVRKKL